MWAGLYAPTPPAEDPVGAQSRSGCAYGTNSYNAEPSPLSRTSLICG